MLANTTGFKNIAIGVSALRNNGTGHDNIAIGQDSCSQSQGGQFNTAVGSNPLVFNSADYNTATGAFALSSNHAGANNTATGAGALESNTGGMDNTADGLNALSNNTGNDNTALGFGAGAAATTGSNDVYIGASMVGVAGESNACYIASIFGQSVPHRRRGRVRRRPWEAGTTVSSRRFKHDIKPMDNASETILALKPMTFHYKNDPKGTPQYGLIAEEVAEVNPNLVVRDKNGQILSVHYDKVWNMMLNEFLKEHKRFEEQQERHWRTGEQRSRSWSNNRAATEEFESRSRGTRKANRIPGIEPPEGEHAGRDGQVRHRTKRPWRTRRRKQSRTNPKVPRIGQQNDPLLVTRWVIPMRSRNA